MPQLGNTRSASAPTSLLDAALVYLAQGISVIPLGQVTYDGAGHKHVQPLIKWKVQPESLVTTAEQAHYWFSGRAAGIAMATGPSGLLMVDLDDYKATFAGVALPQGGWVERGGRGGSHVYFRNPAGARNTQGRLGAGVDSRGVGGLVICAPTVCRMADGSTTSWVSERPLAELDTATLPEAPATLLSASAPARLVLVGTPAEIPRPRAEAAVARTREEYISSAHGERHGTMLAFLGALARMLFAQGASVDDANAALETAVELHPDAATEVFESAPGAIEYALNAARAEPWVLYEETGFEARFTAPFGVAPVAPARGGGLPTLAEQFWTTRPVLEHIRAAAWSRRLSPDAVLHAVLARLAAGRRATIVIDSGIETSSLNYFAAIIGASGTGKSRAWKLAGELLELSSDDCPTRPLGSGEGFSEAFMGVVETIDITSPSNKSTKLRVQVRHNVMFELDEGQALTAMLQRSGATIGPVLRSAWSGAVLGQQNADSERNRRVDGYATGLVAGFQPDSMEALLADTHTGMPQRFVYASATDPAMPRRRTAHPGPLPVELAAVLKGRATNPFTPGVPTGDVVSVPEEVTDDVDAVLLAVADGTVTLAELDSQRVGTMLRLGGLLALLEGRFAVTDEDWALAGVLWAASSAVRDSLVARAVAAAERSREVADGHFATRQVRAATAVDAAPRAVRRVAVRLAQHVHAEGQLSFGAAKQSLASRDRHLFDAAVELAAGEAWLASSESGLTPGGNRPA